MANEPWYADHFRVLSHEECLELLAARPVGRVAFLDAEWPVVLPVNHVLDGSDIVFRTSPHSRLGRKMASGQVCFEVDDFDVAERTGWSVLVRGEAEYDDSDILYPSDQPGPWADGTRSLIVRIRPQTVTGRRLLAR